MTETAAPRSERFEFTVAGTPLVGILRSPPDGVEPVARAVVTGPLTSVKEQSSGMYAAALARRGYEALAFDHRHFGESGGEPRQFENPFAKIEDLRDAVTALEERGARPLPMIGVGVCIGAGYMSRAVEQDDRFKAFAGVAGVWSRRCAARFKLRRASPSTTNIASSSGSATERSRRPSNIVTPTSSSAFWAGTKMSFDRLANRHDRHLAPHVERLRNSQPLMHSSRR